MKSIVLCARDGRPSMKNVYSKMSKGNLVVRRQINNSTYYRVYSGNNVTALSKINKPNFAETQVIIRWGTQEEIADAKGSIIYNKAKSLSLISNKYQSRLAMVKAGVHVPMNVTSATHEDLINYPVIARPFRHSKGKNFITLKNRAAFLQHYGIHHSGWYYSNFIDKVREYRVHAAHGKILNFLEKPNPGGGQIAWNRAQGNEPFVSVKWDQYDFGVALQALKACQALGADFLGVDVIVDRQGKAWVLEGNSAPTLNSSEYSCERYAKYFQWLFMSPERREHWDYNQFKDPQSFAWKNFQLEGKASGKD